MYDVIDASVAYWHVWRNGTSMSAPYVASAVALIMSLYTEWGYADAVARILDTARRVDALEGITVTGEVLEAYAALTYGMIWVDFSYGGVESGRSLC